MNKNIGRLISILHRKKTIYINCALREFNITSSEYAFLLCLYKKEDVTQDELSNYLYIDKSATARAIKSLEKKGYIIKSKDKEDKRFNRIYLTDKAKINESGIKKKISLWSNFLTKDIDEQTANIVFNVLEQMTEKLENTNFKNIEEETYGTC